MNRLKVRADFQSFSFREFIAAIQVNVFSKLVFTTGGDVSATPTVPGKAVYVPDWAGKLYAIDKNTGVLIWSHKISDYDGVPGAIVRVSPAVHGNETIVGDI